MSANDDEHPRSRPKKEKVLHARVPELLEQQIKDRANQLGISVSNLVRNVLSNTFGLVEDLVSDSASVARAFDPHAADGGSVVAWQEVVLNVNAVCGKCNALLPKGVEAHLGVMSGQGPKPVWCSPCIQAVRAKEQP